MEDVENFQAFSVGANHLVCITRNGHIYSAYGPFSELSSPAGIEVFPYRVKKLKNIQKIAVCGHKDLALDNKGQVFAWDTAPIEIFNKSNPRLFGENNKSKTKLHPVLQLSKKGQIEIATTNHFSLCLDSSGNLFGWGENFERVISSLPKEFYGSPKLINNLPKFKTIAASSSHIIALTFDGRVFSWGPGFGGLFGVRGTTRSPELEEFPNPEEMVDIASGLNHCLALGKSGKIYVWGLDYFSQQGRGERRSDAFQPTLLPLSFSVEKISCGQNFSLVLSDAGDVYGWGLNNHNQLSPSAKRHLSPPTLLEIEDSSLRLLPFSKLSNRAVGYRDMELFKRALLKTEIAL